MNKNSWIRFLGMFGIFLLIFCVWNINAEAKRDIIIVIDPGHGGTNMGAMYNDVIEKEATMKVAAAMKEELEKYDGVVVYLTRTNDAELELVERAEFANSVNADILLSLHFNMSEAHDLNGAEMWISSSSRLKKEAERFARIELMLLEDYGIPTRGYFTRYNSQGTDYYGVIRESATYDIPAVIVEHCYLDRPEEEIFYDTDASLDRLGRIDATAVAMAYGLSSQELGVDYSGHAISKTELPVDVINEDVTAPDMVDLQLVSFNPNMNELSMHLKVDDSESSMVYYQISADGGQTFEEPVLLGAEQEMMFHRSIFPADNNDFFVRAYNAYGLYTDSKIYNLNIFFYHNKTDMKEYNAPVSFIEEITEELEDAFAELSPEQQLAAKWILLLGGIFGLIVMALLILQQYREKKQVAIYNSDAKGA